MYTIFTAVFCSTYTWTFYVLFNCHRFLADNLILYFLTFYTARQNFLTHQLKKASFNCEMLNYFLQPTVAVNVRVARVPFAVTVHIFLVEVGHRLAVVAGVTVAVRIRVSLVRVRHQRAVVL